MFEGWLSNLDLVVRDWPEWQKMNGGLRHVANVIKHAEGDSAEKLRSIRPELFLPQFRRVDDEVLRSGLSREFLRRRAPLAGEGIWVSEDDFKGYADAVNAFWSNLARRFDKIR